MALKFFWRCEGTTLDATDDYYGSGDNTATLTGAGLGVDNTAEKIGTYGLLGPGSITGNAAFTATNLWPSATTPGASAGSFAFWFKVVSTWTTTDGLVLGLRCIGATNSDAVRIQTEASSNNRISLALQTTGGGGTYELPVTSGTFAADTWYYVVGRWDYANDKAAIEVYTDAGGSTLAAFASASDIVTNLSPYIPATDFATLQCGARSATQTQAVHSDHYIVSDNYDAPLQNMAFITSATQYSETTGTIKVKILAPAAAASAASIQGVVLNAARDTVIGEFTGQTFEAALEGGEAVLKITATDITPDGATLTTADAPLVVAYNTSYSTDLAAATVIEE